MAKFDIPLLVIHGDSDAIVSLEVSGQLAHEAVAGSQLVVIEGGPHGLNATHPEEFNTALIHFLNT
ncbi:Arylesterase [compost metagenome]